MRIDPVFTVAFAITLVAVAGNRSGGSGLTDRATRSAQLSQLAQTPNPPPAGQPGPVGGACAPARRSASRPFFRYAGGSARRSRGLHDSREERAQQRR